MIEIIAGEKGKGKTKELIAKVNEDIKFAKGHIIYLDKNSKHMFELNNRIRLINVFDYPVTNTDMFLGFIAGTLSADHDVDKIYLDSFLTIAYLDPENLESAITKLQEISNVFQVDFVISISVDQEELPASIRSMVTVSL